ncbi:MAG: hypothetical protein ACP5N3_01510 [Candidatus Nanoarchaeia archaeon]
MKMKKTNEEIADLISRLAEEPDSHTGKPKGPIEAYLEFQREVFFKYAAADEKKNVDDKTYHENLLAAFKTYLYVRYDFFNNKRTPKKEDW